MGAFQFDHLEQPPAGDQDPDRVIIILHGYGGNARRSMELGPWLSAAFPAALVVAPEGILPLVPLLDPKSPDMSDQPVDGRRVWYQRYSEATRQEGLAVMRIRLDRYIDEWAQASGLARDRVVLIGISQGAITLLNSVPFFDRPVGAAVAHSGYLFSPDSLASRKSQLSEFRTAAVGTTPFCCIHGLLDVILPYQTHLEAATLLDETGIPTEFHLLSGLTHADFDARSQQIAIEFIRRQLTKTNSS